MTKAVRYQEGYLYKHHGAWFVRYRERVQLEDGSIKFRQRAKRLASVKRYPNQSEVKPLLTEFRQRLNAGKQFADASMTLQEFFRANLRSVHPREARVHEKGIRGSVAESHWGSRRPYSPARVQNCAPEQNAQNNCERQ